MMKRVLRAAVAAAAIVVATGGLAACSSASGGTGGTTAAANLALHLWIPAPPSSFQIGSLDNSQDNLIYGSVYETVIGRDASGGFAPGIATSWAYSTDLKTLTLKIRPGERFSDGEALDAQAVVDSLEMARKGPETAQAMAPVKNITAQGPGTVVITLSQPDAALLANLQSSAGFVAAPKTLTAPSSKTDPIGSGPYILNTGQTVAGVTYTLTRNPQYWNVRSYPYQTVQVKVIADPTATANAMRSGQVDMIYTDASTAKSFPAGQFRTGVYPGISLGALWLADRNGTVVPALKDIRVREAINMALDRPAIVKGLLYGLGQPTDQVFSPAGAAYSQDLNNVYPYDPAEAKKLMAEAGYANGFSVTMPSTVLSQPYESTITQELGDIGIKANWVPVQLPQALANIFSRTYGMYFMLSGYAGDAIGTSVVLGGIFNPFHSTTPQLQQLLTAINTSTGAAQVTAYQNLNEYFVKQAWYAPIYSGATEYISSKSVIFQPPTGTAVTTLLNFKPAQ